MFRSLTASDHRFKSLTFHEGLNLLVAETTPKSQRTDSRNGAGKTSAIEVIHFLLGANANKHLCTRTALEKTTFTLEMDWPGHGTVKISRNGTNARHVGLDPNVARSGNLYGTDVEGWREEIDRTLFALPDDHKGVSGRALLSYLIRRVITHGFNEPTEWTSRPTSKAESRTNLAYLLGLDWQLADKYRDITVRDRTRRELRKAAKDPAWNNLVGHGAEIEGKIRLVQADLETLKRQVKEFRVVPQFESLKTRADVITRTINDISDADVVDQRNLAELEAAVADETDVEIDYLEPVYAELGIILGDQVQRRYDEVRTFHSAVVRNRRHFLREELDQTKQRLAERVRERSRLDEERAGILKQLSRGGALESLEILHNAAAAKEAELGMLRQRLETAKHLEATTQQLKVERAELSRDMNTDLSERAAQVTEASNLFTQFARHLYGDRREAFLIIEAKETSLRIDPHIAEDDSTGIGNMKIFCFDLAMAVVAHRHGRAPDFLVHDGALYDGVDARQIALALDLATEVARAERMQYLVTMNSDDLEKAAPYGFDPTPHIIEPRLTDADDKGGLFGFRFDV